jgi:hypothetical protein
VADVLDTKKKAGGDEGSDPYALARNLWLDKSKGALRKGHLRHCLLNEVFATNASAAPAVEGNIAQHAPAPRPVESSATNADAAPAVEGGQHAPAPRPAKTSATDANAENTNENRNPAPHKGLYETEIGQLRSMGFIDDESITAALNATKVNVEYALWRLL